MNKEQQELLDEVYENYWNSHPDAEKTFQYEGHNIETRRMTKDEFVDMVKTDKEYGRRWGLKIEERELSRVERNRYVFENVPMESNMFNGFFASGVQMISDEDFNIVFSNIPTRLITITYNDKTIESYE